MPRGRGPSLRQRCGAAARARDQAHTDRERRGGGSRLGRWRPAAGSSAASASSFWRTSAWSGTAGGSASAPGGAEACRLGGRARTPRRTQRRPPPAGARAKIAYVAESSTRADAPPCTARRSRGAPSAALGAGRGDGAEARRRRRRRGRARERSAAARPPPRPAPRATERAARTEEGGAAPRTSSCSTSSAWRSTTSERAAPRARPGSRSRPEPLGAATRRRRRRPRNRSRRRRPRSASRRDGAARAAAAKAAAAAMAAAAASLSDSTLRVSGCCRRRSARSAGCRRRPPPPRRGDLLATPGHDHVGAPARWRGAAAVIGLGSLWKSALSSCATSSSSLAILADLGGGSSWPRGPVMSSARPSRSARTGRCASGGSGCGSSRPCGPSLASSPTGLSVCACVWVSQALRAAPSSALSPAASWCAVSCEFEREEARRSRERRPPKTGVGVKRGVGPPFAATWQGRPRGSRLVVRICLLARARHVLRPVSPKAASLPASGFIALAARLVALAGHVARRAGVPGCAERRTRGAALPWTTRPTPIPPPPLPPGRPIQRRCHLRHHQSRRRRRRSRRRR